MSSVLTPCNARVLTVCRAGDSSFDRYGQPNNVTIFTLVKCRLSLKNRVIVGEDGDAVKIDAQLWFPPDKELFPGDIVTIDTPGEPVYKVITVSDARDVMGTNTGRRYTLVKQRTK